jgi:kynurenine formamidase
MHPTAVEGGDMADRSEQALAFVRAIRGGMIKLIDLSILIANDHPCTWPGTAPFNAFIVHRYDNPEDPDYIRMVVTDEHVGTHMDAPGHYVPSAAGTSAVIGITTDQVPLTTLFGPAAVIDVTELTGQGEPGKSPEIRPERIASWEEKYGRITPEDIVLFYSGWSARYLPGEAGRSYAWDPILVKNGPSWPGLTEEAMQLLADRGVKVVGTEGGGPGVSERDARTHQIGLGAGMVFIERLANLHLLPARGAGFCFLPVHWAEGSGAPGRAIALVARSA